ncbi:hypothetical protein [Nocardioides sp. GCM10030258]|uniref:hypothetical protein n=1 Tax=unclassified Nocardioides TaxID=2615069 RepID=UPI0036201CCD
MITLLATHEGDVRHGPTITLIDIADETLDWLGRKREPWARLARMRLAWTAPTAAIALVVATRGAYDDRRVALALRGAGQVCTAGWADSELLDALDRCARFMDSLGEEWTRVAELRNLARRVIASATPPEILDLSLLVDGDGWADQAREAARTHPAATVSPLVRLLGDLGPRKPSQRWWKDVENALRPVEARQLLLQWLELAAAAEAVPEWPGSRIGYCCGVLFVGTNVDLVRAAVLATSRLPEDASPAEALGTLARRGSAHNGMAGMPEALALKVASAAVDALSLRGSEADRLVLARLLTDLHRRDLVKRVAAALAD